MNGNKHPEVKPLLTKFLWVAILSSSFLACRPVFTIGWTELIVLFILIAILLGPLILRIYGALDKVRKAAKDTKNDDPGANHK